MKKTFLFASLCAFLFSCKKEDTPSKIKYTNLNNIALTNTNHVNIDLDKDGVNDFYATTVLVDVSENDHLQFIINSEGANRIATKEEQVPKMMEIDEAITKENMAPFEWSPLNKALIVERVMPIDAEQAYWQGTWKEKQNRYLPVQVVKDSKTYNGWIRISFSSEAPYKIILHDAAVSKVEDASIKAGQK